VSRGETIQDLIDEIRSTIEEENEVQVQDDRDLLPIINSAHEKAFEVLSQVYSDPILTFSTHTLSEQVWTLPENIFQEKIRAAVWVDASDQKIRDCKKSSIFTHLDKQTTVGSGFYPSSYISLGRRIKFSSVPNGRLMLFYLKEIDRLVRPIATIDSISGTDTILFSDLDPEYDPTLGRLDSYLNIIDGQTGLVKGSVQVKTLGTASLEIKSIPERSRVLNRTISSDLTTLTDELSQPYTIEGDDYLCSVKGTCVLPYLSLIKSYVKQESIATLKRNQGFAYDVDQQLVAQFRSDMQKSANAERDNPMTIRHRNACWNSARWVNI
jgi:hypothetical protein